MKYLRSFENQSAYTTAKGGKNFYRPCVSLIEDSMAIKFDPKPWVFEPQYLLWDGSALSKAKTVGSGQTAIGVEVIPAAHMADGKSRWVSVKNMSKAAGEVETGSTATGNDENNAAAGIRWGKTSDDVPGMTNYSAAGKKLAVSQASSTAGNPFGIQEELANGNGQYLVTDYDNGIQDNMYPFFENAYYVLDPVSGTQNNLLPYPFSFDGSKNSLYWGSGQAGTAISDMNGAANTAILVGRSPSYSSGEALNNEVSEINHPAAVACHRFTAGVSSLAGEWYLPSAGELGYLWANVNKINAKIAAISTDGVKIGVSNDESASVDSLGSRLWSSSECNGSIAWCLGTNNGFLYDNYKGYSLTYLRVRAFLAY